MDKKTLALIDALKAEMVTLSQGERGAVMVMLQTGYCKECMTDDPKCQCWNDE